MPVEPNAHRTYDDFEPPEGWAWQSRPRYYAPRDADRGLLRAMATRRSLGGVAEDMAALYKWAMEQDVFIDIQRMRNLPIGEQVYRVPDRIGVNPVYALSETGQNMGMDRPCPYPGCDGVINGGMAVCPSCEGELICSNDRQGFGSVELIAITHEEPIRLGCRACVRGCHVGDCDNTVPRHWRFCEEHGAHWTCGHCDKTFDEDMGLPVGDGLCANCMALRCFSCHTFEEVQETEEGMLCKPCYLKISEGRAESAEVSSFTATDWLMESLPERPIRLISIEQEFEAASPETGGYRSESLCGNLLASKLYHLGMSPFDHIASYHSSGHDLPCHVETDASVTSGGELILQKLKLDTLQDAGYIAQIEGTVGEMLADDQIRFTTRCGTHIHVDLHGYTVPDARALVTVYSYLEDVIYRLGSAGFGDHREIVYQGGYSLPIKKDKWGDIKKFGVEFLRRADHTDSLNLQHFYASMQKCKCGAIEFGNMADCECIRKKCTAEWRVFNGTGDPRKLHAYIALVQAITAWSQDRILDVEGFPALEFRGDINFTENLTFHHYKLMDEWIERLEWMRRHLPLTENEWESIFYCIGCSPLRHLGPERLAEIAAVEYMPENDRRITVPANALRGVSETREPDRFVDGICQNCHEIRHYCECDFEDGYPEEAPF